MPSRPCRNRATIGWPDTTTRGNVVVKLHLGPVAIGKVGSPGEEIIDVYGKTVSVAVTLSSTGFAMTSAVFRSLQPVTRKLFKKHTPPVSYIEMEGPALRRDASFRQYASRRLAVRRDLGFELVEA